MFHGIVEKDISSFKSVVGEELSDESEISQTQHGCFYGGIVFCIGGRTFSILFGSVQRHLGAKRKGYYLLCMVLITISCIVVQKVVRDNTEDKEFRLDNPKHRGLHNYGFCGFDYRVCDVFIGLYNAPFELNVKGYYIAVILLISYSAIGVQKVTRDNAEDNEILAEQEARRDIQG